MGRRQVVQVIEVVVGVWRIGVAGGLRWAAYPRWVKAVDHVEEALEDRLHARVVMCPARTLPSVAVVDESMLASEMLLYIGHLGI